MQWINNKSKSLKYLILSLFLIHGTCSFSQEIVEDTGIKKEILREGKGEVAKIGQKVKVSLTGTLTDGYEFESGIMSFIIGDKDMIPGFNKILPSMKKGEKVRITLPPKMGYGEKEMKDEDVVIIPSNSILIFEIQLLSIK